MSITRINGGPGRCKPESAEYSSKENVLAVGQGEVGYLNSELMEYLDVDSIETDAIGPCVGVGLLDTDSGSMALAHVDSAYQKLAARAYNVARNSVNADFDRAIVVTNGYDEKTAGEVTSFLEEQVNDLETDFEIRGNGRALGVNEEGFYLPGKGALPEIEDSELFSLEVMGRASKNSLDDFVTVGKRTEKAIENKLEEERSHYGEQNLPEVLIGDKRYASGRVRDGEIEINYRIELPSELTSREDIPVEVPDIFSVELNHESGTEIDPKIKSSHAVEKDEKRVKQLNQVAAEIWKEVGGIKH
ncbi:MAG: hypothetical protein SVV03_05640 [Candidatus Nanohaloarchaea archaeon]|nr:hypothetical protein [Candidatus Nanohaloarchaea archaeon]